jgi:hypothetical protein
VSGQAIDLGVAGVGDAGRAQVIKGLEAAIPAASHATQLIVLGSETIDGDTDLHDTRLGHGGATLGGEVVRTCDHGAAHSLFADVANHQQEVVAQIGLAADQDDLSGPELCQFIDDRQALVERELRSACGPSPGPTGRAF